VDIGGPGLGAIEDTFNHASLTPDFVSGVDDFDAYMLLGDQTTGPGISPGPQHTTIFSGYEYFSASGVNNGQVTYDIGSILAINVFALWNEESAGMSNFDLQSSTDGVTFTPIPGASGLFGTDHQLGDSGTYGPDKFFFVKTSMRYIRLANIVGPQTSQGIIWDGLAIGEVAVGDSSSGGTTITEVASATDSVNFQIATVAAAVSESIINAVEISSVIMTTPAAVAETMTAVDAVDASLKKLLWMSIGGDAGRDSIYPN